MADYLSAQEAATRLGISTATLYSYVSRGLLRSEPSKGKTRRKRYRLDDVRRLEQKQTIRREPEKAAEGALSWGMPVLDSSITLIQDGRLYYRGQDALQLATSRSFEEVATLLWTGNFEAAGRLFDEPPPKLNIDYPVNLSTVERFQTILPQVAAVDLAAYDLSAESTTQTGARLLKSLTQAITEQPFDQSVAHSLQQQWQPEQPAVKPLLEAALILCADHELNVSAFTARCVASARGTPYQAVIAALAAFSGYRHGGASVRVEAFFHEARNGVQQTIKRYLQTGQALPGFMHPLYPDGDPRGRLLLELVGGRDKVGDEILAVTNGLGFRPNIDFALVYLQDGLGLPTGAGQVLFGIGRTAGWIAHCIEQYALDPLIRPRARYIGNLPAS